MRTVLFICTGNTCRSPMAEAIARRAIERGEVGEDAGDIFAVSAGVSAAGGARTTPEAVEALARQGIEFDGRSTALSAEMIRKADLVLCMTASHVEIARDLVRGEEDQERKIHRLDPAHDLEDPIGMGEDAYDRIAERLLRVIPSRLREFLGPQPAQK